MNKALVAVLGICSIATWAQAENHVKVFNEIKHDVSQPLRDMAKSVTVQKQAPRENDVRRSFVGANTASATDVASHPADVNGSRPLVGTVAGLNFDGQSADGVAPPDTTGSIGATQFVQWVNSEYNVYDKTTGAKTLGPIAGNALWSGFGGACQTRNDGDPIVLFDKLAGRWFFAQNTFATPYTTCIAVSTTSDATGSFNRYAFAVTPTTSFPDYPKWGIWSDGYYQTFNAFKNGQSFANSEVCAADRTNILAGNAATLQCFTTTSAYFSLLPADNDGLTAPPAGEPESLADWIDTTHINFWQFHVDFAVPANSTFTGPTAVVVNAFTQVCPTTRICVPEGSGEKVDSLGDRLMYRLAYRNFGTYESMLMAQTVKPVAHTTSTTAVRWYEFRNPASPTVFQQATFQDAATKNYWIPSIAQDKQGNIAMGFSSAAKVLNPSVWYTGRLVTDPINTMETTKVMVAGTGFQKTTSNRWGDYSTMSVDPNDDCTFWFTEEYYKTTGSFNWATRIGSFKFPGCI